ncbi:hypothetical protein [Aliiruegeria lutimaris]|uniref:Uncharacterized protein n=1 Tax=Aliiruegeria lutimaris TaxID=571298 RepID=A0A1G9MDC0_9RHOB|nr:hypothetical protein [Aliiruegeria lutimaris]SDL72199.1 hypothetical protein SAMN04488026_11091 [Aliiruegeria lutimaris]
MEHNYSIATMSVIDGPANGIGNRLLALFDLEVAGLRISNCLLVQNADGLALAKGPTGKNHKGNLIRAQFISPEVVRAVTRRAASAYTALTGRDLEDEC